MGILAVESEGEDGVKSEKNQEIVRTRRKMQLGLTSQLYGGQSTEARVERPSPKSPKEVFPECRDLSVRVPRNTLLNATWRRSAGASSRTVGSPKEWAGPEKKKQQQAARMVTKEQKTRILQPTPGQLSDIFSGRLGGHVCVEDSCVLLQCVWRD